MVHRSELSKYAILYLSKTVLPLIKNDNQKPL